MEQKEPLNKRNYNGMEAFDCCKKWQLRKYIFLEKQF